VIARHLENRGMQVSVLLFCDPDKLYGDAAINFGILRAAKTAMWISGLPPDFEQLDRELNNCEWIVDALLGTGAQGEIRDPFRGVIDCMNRANASRLAVDLPSGLDCDTGQPLGCCVCADHTATFVASKLGFNAPGAENWTGQVHIVDIGIPRRLLLDLKSVGDEGSRPEWTNPT
jgi:NAD(P)H-hydrate epimerase